MKILLAVPPATYFKGEHYFITFPLGLSYLAAELVKKHSVEILDCLIEDPKSRPISKEKYFIGLSWDKIKRRLKEINPNVVGISCAYSSQYDNAVKLAETVKEHDKNTTTILGGAHPSALPDDVLKNPCIDFVAIGESEESFVKLVDALKEGKSFNPLDGIGYKKRGDVIINKKSAYKKNIDRLPFPARHLFPMEKYFSYGREHAFYSKNYPSTTLITSRGCPGRCIYCSIRPIFGRFWRARSPSNIVKELEHLKKKYGIREVHFEDDNLTLDKKRVMNLCEKMTSTGLELSWTMPNGVSIKHLDEELIKKMKESGCYRAFIGIESGNQRVLKEVIKKELSLTKAEEIICLLKKYKIKVTGFFIIGLPGESKRDIGDTIRFATSHDFDDASFSIASPYPGTELYKICIDQGFVIEKDFSKRNPYHAVISTEEFDCKEITLLRNKACFRFQLSKVLRHPVRYFSEKQNYVTFLRHLKFLIVSNMS